MSIKPKLSIVVVSQTYPVQLFENLNEQINATKDLVEVLLVLNGIDRFEKYQAYSWLRCFSLKTASPYGARNLAVAHAKGAHLAFIDSDCAPSNEWLDQILFNVDESPDKIIGGGVQFSYPLGKTAPEIYDSISFLQMKDCIEERNVALTLNLLVPKILFSKLGGFLETTQSGGDVEWTRQAYKSGVALKFAAGMSVTHPARGFLELLKKAQRVGRGKADAFWSLSECSKLVQLNLLNPLYLLRRTKSVISSLSIFKLSGIWMTGFCVLSVAALSFTLAVLQGIFGLRFLKKKEAPTSV